METLEQTPKTIQKQQTIQLIEGHFTASEARDIIDPILDVKINFHKINRMRDYEGNISEEGSTDFDRIEDLYLEKEKAKAFLRRANFQGKKLKMTSTIHITIED